MAREDLMGAGLYSARVELMQTTGHHGSESEEARTNLTNTMQTETVRVKKPE